MSRTPLFSRLFASLLIGLLSVMTLGGCSSKSSNTNANVRFVNLMSDQAKISVTLNDAAAVSDLAFQAISTYQERPSGTYTSKITGATGATLLTPSLALGQLHYTIYVYGTAASPRYAAITDEPVVVNTGKYVVRTMLGSTNLPVFDLYISSAEADLSTLSPVAYGGAVATATGYTAEADSGTFRIRLTLSGTKDLVFDSTQAFDAKSANTLVFFSQGSAQLPTVLFMHPEEGNTKVVTNTLARLRIVQGSPDVTGTRVSIDGKNTFQSLPFGASTGYITVNAGARALSFANESSGAKFAEANQTLLPGHDYTLITKGLAATATQLLFEENSTGGSTLARPSGRFINAASDQPTIDVVFNYQALLSGLAAGSRSAAQDFDAVAYPLSYYSSTGGGPLVQQTTDVLATGGIYSFALLGAANNYKAVMFRTN